MRYAVAPAVFFECTRFFAAGPAPPVLPVRDTGELAAAFFVAPLAAVGAAARAFADAFFGIAILPKYCFSWRCVGISLGFRRSFTGSVRSRVTVSAALAPFRIPCTIQNTPRGKSPARTLCPHPGTTSAVPDRGTTHTRRSIPRRGHPIAGRLPERRRASGRLRSSIPDLYSPARRRIRAATM